VDHAINAGTAATSESAAPYLSVVVTTRNDDHGGDPLQRLQAFVNTFDEQCRRTGLDAEVIVAEWNPPPDRPRVAEVLRIPVRSACTYRFVNVPAELHQRFQLGDVLPLFQMIGKNVGIRRARGRFVVATNVDIIFSTELVEYLASRPLQPGRLYRVDRHDIQSHIPVDGSLEEQTTYCASNQLRVHTRSGSHPVAPDGQLASQPEDIVDGQSVRLGVGWHIRESTGLGQTFRWAGEVATLRLDPGAAGHRGESVLHLEIESNPYDASSAVDIEIADGAAVLGTWCLEGRRRIAVPLRTREHSSPREIAVRVTHAQPDWRTRLPIFERRRSMHYRVYSAALSPAGVPDPALVEYSLEGWEKALRWSWNAVADPIASVIAAVVGRGVRYRIARRSREYRNLEAALRASDEEVRRLAPLQDLADLHKFLRDQRPDELHVNACGDFQLMARGHWHELRGYPEFQTFSMNIDGLFSYIADAAGIREEMLPFPIYHLEHEKGSGWSPEGESLLRQRIAERGITWVDASTVYTWAAYMKWLGRPMIFNDADWGFGSANLVERQVSPALAPS